MPKQIQKKKKTTPPRKEGRHVIGKNYLSGAFGTS